MRKTLAILLFSVATTAGAQSFQLHGFVTAREIYPGADKQSDEDLADYARAAVYTYHHQVGTCKMGNDDMAVVDHELKVRGVQGLRVVDASIMPTVPTGNTNAPTVMIAEKAADMIKAGA